MRMEPGRRVLAAAVVVAAAACSSNAPPRPLVKAAPATASPSGAAATHLPPGAVLLPNLPPPSAPAPDCSKTPCGYAGDPFGPVWLRGDAHLEGGCVWAEPASTTGGAMTWTLLWPQGTYAIFGKVIRVYDSAGRLVGDSVHPFRASAVAPADFQFPHRCLVSKVNVAALDVA
jgi:hypothetical protein